MQFYSNSIQLFKIHSEKKTVNKQTKQFSKQAISNANAKNLQLTRLVIKRATADQGQS